MRPISRNQNSDLETRLQQERPEPSAEFLASVESRVTGAPRRPATRFRYGLAAGFAASVAIVFAAFGGLGTFSTPTVSSRITLAVPASAVPGLKKLQAQGGILAASPVQATKADLKAGKVKGVVLAPISGDVTTAVGKAKSKTPGLRFAPFDKSVRTSLVPPALGGSGPIVRYAATVVYVPGGFIPACVTFGGGIYYSVLWPLNVALPPGSSYGFCPGFVPPPVPPPV